MAQIEKRGKRWRARVRGAGVSATFSTKAEAVAWGVDIERRIAAGGMAAVSGRTFGDLLEHYQRVVTPRKRVAAWEARRIDFLLRDPLARVKLCELDSTHFAAWRDRRLAEVSGSTITRDANLMSHALTVARREWRWIGHNPLSDVSRPRENPPRERIATEAEIAALCLAGGYRVGQPAATLTARATAAFVFAVETAMRASEILGLTPASVRGGTVAVLPLTKNGERREVPLSLAAQQVLRDVGGAFGLTEGQRDALWRKVRARAGVEGLTFHDGRATAITRLSRRLDPLALARMVGHRDVRQLMVYYREAAESIAARL